MTSAIISAVAHRVRDLAAAEIPEDSDLIDLSGDWLGGNTVNILRSETISALQKHLGDHYTRRQGILPLCRAIANDLASRGLSVDAATNVVITGSVAEARFVALRVLAAHKMVYLPYPVFLPHYLTGLSFAQASIHFFDPKAIMPTEQGDLLVLPNPNPATGQVYSTETLEQVALWASTANMIVVADETLMPLLYPGISSMHFATISEMGKRTLTLGSFMDISGLDGWLVSWIVGPQFLIEPVRDLKQAMTICSAAISQYAALAGVRYKDGIIRRRNVERIHALEVLLERLHIPYDKPHTVAYIFADVNKLGGSDIVTDLCARHGVIVANGSSFGRSGWIRITISGDRFDEGLQRLEAALSYLQRERSV